MGQQRFESFSTEQDPARIIGTAIPSKEQTQTSPSWNDLILENIQEAIFSLDRSWYFTSINNRAARLLGRSKEALLGKSIWQEFPDLLGSNFEEVYWQALAQNKPCQHTLFYGARNSWYDVEVCPIPQGLIIHIQDITRRKQLEQSLRESEHRFKVLSEATFEGVLIHQNGVIIEANQSAAQMVGYNNPQELIGLPIETFSTPESMAQIQKQIASGAKEAYEGVASRKDGSQFPVEARGKSIEYRGQTVRVSALRDLTDRKLAEEQLRKTQSQLRQAQKMESLGHLTGGIAHDFNNLLTAIMGYTELILLKLNSSDKLYPDIIEIQKATERAATLTGQLLAFSRQQVLQPKVLNLNLVITDMVKLLHRLIDENIEVSPVLQAELNEVLIDPGQLEQIILNLAVNARDAMPDGGKLTIETANVELDEQVLPAGQLQAKPGSYVMLAISDTGIGMDQATQERIFEPFFTTKDSGKGTGLGLATVYGIVKQSDGYVMVHSEPGIGTTFKIYFPRIIKAFPPVVTPRINDSATSSNLNHANKAISSPVEPGQSKEHGYTVLVVEDEALIRELIHRVLLQAGYKVMDAHNGWEALRFINTYSGELDLVITDIVMPKMGGQELVQRLRERWANVKVLSMSGYMDQTTLRHNNSEPYDYYLQKPFTPTNLLRQVEEVMASSSEDNWTE